MHSYQTPLSLREALSIAYNTKLTRTIMAIPMVERRLQSSILNKRYLSAERALAPISDEEMGNLLATFGNSELKVTLMLLMRPGQKYTAGDLHERLIATQGGVQMAQDRGWYAYATNVERFLSETFADIGQIVTVSREGVTSLYELSDKYNPRLLHAFGGWLLYLAHRYPPALADWFGATTSPQGKTRTVDTAIGLTPFTVRGPYLSLQIYRRLLESPQSLTESELSHEVGSQIATRLAKLSASGIITYETEREKHPIAYYALAQSPPPHAPPPSPYNKTITRLVQEILTESPTAVDPVSGEPIRKWWTISDMTQEVMRHRPQRKQRFATWNEVDLALSFLRHHGFAEIQKFHSLRKTATYLTEEQRGALFEVDTILTQLQTGDTQYIEIGQKLVQAVLQPGRPDFLLRILRKAREANNRTTEGKNRLPNQLLSVLYETTGAPVTPPAFAAVPDTGFSPTELFDLVCQRLPAMRTRRRSVANALKRLQAEGLVSIVARVSNRPRYQLNPHSLTAVQDRLAACGLL